MSQNKEVYFIDHLNRSIHIVDNSLDAEMESGINRDTIETVCTANIGIIIEGYSFYYMRNINTKNQPRIQSIDKKAILVERYEIWKDVKLPSLIGYQVSTRGRIRYIDQHSQCMELFRYYNNNGYNCVNINNYKVALHRLVALTFIDLPEEGKFEKLIKLPKDGIPYIINHKDGIKCNNRPHNLEWCDSKHNSNHAYTSGLTSINIKCRMLDIDTGTWYEFESMRKLALCLAIPEYKVPTIIAKHTKTPYKGKYIFDEKTIPSISLFKNGEVFKIYIKDYVTNEVFEVNTLKEASVITGVSRSTLDHRLVEDISSNNDLLLAGYIFRCDNDIHLPWPVYTKEQATLSRRLYLEKLSLGDQIANGSKFVEVKDYITGHITKFNSIREACLINNYKISVIDKYIVPKKEREKLPLLDGKVFRVLAYGYDWPEYTKEEVENSKKVYTDRSKERYGSWKRISRIGKNYLTNEIKEFSSAKDIALELNSPIWIADSFFYTNNNRRKTPINGWYFLTKDSNDEWPLFTNEQLEYSFKYGTNNDK